MSEQEMAATQVRRRAGCCATHDDLAWLYSDGSMSCLFCLVIESNGSDCRWRPMPSYWMNEGQSLSDDEPEDNGREAQSCTEWHPGRCSMTASLGPASPDCPECEGSGWRIDDEAPADFLPEWCWCRDRSIAVPTKRLAEPEHDGSHEVAQ